MGRTANYSGQQCTVAATLEVVGDPWTLLILRDAFLGITRFEQWRDKLGLARNVLAQRLKTLVEEGLMERRPYSDRPVRHEYLLTAKGEDIYPILMAMMGWGKKHAFPEDGAPIYVHTVCEHELDPVLVCGVCSEPFSLATSRPDYSRVNKRTAA